MKTFWKPMFAALTLALGLALPQTTEALPTNLSYDIYLDGAPVGTMTFRNKVTDSGEGRCQYTARWTFRGPAYTRSQVCKIDEFHAGDNFDCEVNRYQFFTTLISASSLGCSGFDYFGQATKMPLFIAGEAASGSFHGIAMSASVGDVEGLAIYSQVGANSPPVLQ